MDVYGVLLQQVLGHQMGPGLTVESWKTMLMYHLYDEERESSQQYRRWPDFTETDPRANAYRTS
jgi:hypothetical protein